MSDARVNRLAYLSMYVHDLAESRRFYAELLGLEVEDEGTWGIVLGTGNISLFLHAEKTRPGQHLEFTFDVDDVDAAIEALRSRGVPVADEPAERDWGDRDGAVTDPDGNVVYLRSARVRR